MRTERALRYLLLRHLERFESVVPRETFQQVVTSLRVEADREGFEVQWSRGERAERRRFSRTDFAFYARGDRSPEDHALSESLANRNDETAQAFAEEVFGRVAPPLRPALAPPREPYRSVVALGAAALGAALWAIGGLAAGEALLVALWALSEYAPRGRWLGCVPLLALAVSGTAPAALLGALAYGALQALDPDPRGRRSRIALCALASLVAASRLAGVALGAAQLGLLLVAVGLAAERSFFASHFRAVPLALPFFLAGLSLGGELRAALVGLALAALGSAGFALLHRIRPVRPGP